MNRENFERVKAAILANAETLNMMTWGSKDSSSPCGTVGCMAGFCDWLMAVDGLNDTLFEASGKLSGRHVEDDEGLVTHNAKQFLEISDDQAHLLFFTWEWPSRLGSKYSLSINAKQRAKVVVERIDHFLATGL